MFTLDGFDNTAWFLTCYQFFIYGILAFIHLGVAGLEQRRYEEEKSPDSLNYSFPSFKCELSLIFVTCFSNSYNNGSIELCCGLFKLSVSSFDGMIFHIERIFNSEHK